MDFSNNAFRPQSNVTLSDDTMSHAKLVMACRFGWTAGPSNDQLQAPPSIMPAQAPPITSTNDLRVKRFTPCRGRLYHQLTCSHRIRTDLVEDCGPNCLDPLTNPSNLPFFCNECVSQEAQIIWNRREAEHNGSYPPLNQMTTEEYDRWYEAHRLLEAQLGRDRKSYEFELKAKTRPSNICSIIEASKEELDFAAEFDSLSLSMVSSNDSTANNLQHRAHQVSLPSDASEQLHWSLNSLALDRGSCGVEYSTTQSGNSVQPMMPLDEQELWRKPRDRK